MATDPICGMYVDERPDSLHLVRDGRTYWFCSEVCRQQFAAPDRERRRLLQRLAVAWPLAIAVVVLAYAVPGRPSVEIAAGLATVVQGYAGLPFYRGAYDAIRGRIGNMDLLIATGTTAAYGYSLAVVVRPGTLPPATFFDASTLILSLILTGNLLEQLTRRRASAAALRLGELRPSSVIVVRDGVAREVPLAEVRPGDRLKIRAGSRFPTDGIVRDGHTTVDESILTGEPSGVARGPGDRVLAGSMNGPGFIEVEATGVGADSFLASVGRLMTEAEMSRIPVQRRADRIAAVFTPAVLVLAVGASLTWYLVGGADLAIAVLVFVSVVITACPCAFGIATPAALLVGVGRAAEEGILFRGADAVDAAARVTLVLTDKTGTLTASDPEVSSLVPAPGQNEEAVLALAAGLEVGADHPMARATLREAQRRGLAPVPVGEIVAEPGSGVRGRLGALTVAFRRGRDDALGPDPHPSLVDAARAAETRGDSWSAVLEDGTAVGVLTFRSALAPGVPEAIASLRADGIEVGIVTGDHAAAAQNVASTLGIRRVHAGASPAEKIEIIRAYRAEGRRVAFVGDGVNDAPALLAADVGIAEGTGTEVAREAGQVLLVRADFRGVPEALRAARAMVTKVRGNLTWAIGYNAVLLPLAAGLLVPWLGFHVYEILPVAGACAMAVSSTTVVLNSLSLRWGRAGPPKPAKAALAAQTPPRGVPS